MCYTTESYEDDVSVLRQINPNIIALDEKTLEAERRSYHTFFDVHVVETRDGYILIEEGDYGEAKRGTREAGEFRPTIPDHLRAPEDRQASASRIDPASLRATPQLDVPERNIERSR